MTTATPARPFEVRHLQLARAIFAALAAVMITFSTDHSAAVGLSVFSGFAIATGIIWFASIWLVFPAGSRWPSVLLGILTIVAGMVTGMPPLRTDVMFFVVVIAWALLTGLVEMLAGLRARKDDDVPPSQSRDGITVGILTMLLAVGLAVVPVGYSLQYTIEEAGQTFTLTGITIGVGVFGGYAAIVAVYLAIAAFSPRARAVVAVAEAPDQEAEGRS
ncbi:hypothetical protein GCM10009808_20660 [Microbacterium sediminicola]|uniref:Acyl-CoA synthetase n=1 Tax=Microbacterium sediminicola TaxID=415210 RepID=A0ABP4UF30_9MICO